MAGINHDVINIRIKNQECRQALSCASDPLQDKLKNEEKKARKCFLSGLEKRSSTDYFSPDKTSTAESAAVATKSYGYTEEFDDYTSTSSKDSFAISLSKSEKKKKKDKKKSKKRKKQGEKLLGFLDDNLLEKNPRNANLLADVYKSSQDIVAKDGFLYVYSDEDGCFHLSGYNEIAAEMKYSLDEESQIKISQRDYKEAVDLLGAEPAVLDPRKDVSAAGGADINGEIICGFHMVSPFCAKAQ